MPDPPARLDERTEHLVRLGALLALGPGDDLGGAVDGALEAGITADEVVDVLASIAPLIGLARLAAVAAPLALALGYDVEDALERLDTAAER